MSVECVSNVIFGNQKQSNRVNRGVAKVIAGALKDTSTESGVCQSIIDFLTEYAAHPDMSNKYIVQLIVGRENLKVCESSNCVVSYSNISASSPKIVFEYTPISDPNALRSNPVILGKYWNEEIKDPKVESLKSENHGDPMIDRVNKIKDKVKPHVTAEAKAKYPDDEYGQCLYTLIQDRSLVKKVF